MYASKLMIYFETMTALEFYLILKPLYLIPKVLSTCELRSPNNIPLLEVKHGHSQN